MENEADNLQEKLRFKFKNRGEAKMDDFDAFFDLSIRADYLTTCWNQIIDYLLNGTNENQKSFVESISFSTYDWSVARYRKVVEFIEIENRQSSVLNEIMENINSSILAIEAVENGLEDDSADAIIAENYWEKVCKLDKVKFQASSFETKRKIRGDAKEYFTNELKEACGECHIKNLISASMFLPKLEHGSDLFDVLYPICKTRLSAEELIGVLIPGLLLRCIIDATDEKNLLIVKVLQWTKSIMTAKCINGALEFSGHSASSCASLVILNDFKHLINVQGIIATMIPASAKGIEHTIDKLQLSIISNLNFDLQAGIIFRDTLVHPYSFLQYISPFIYIFIGVATGIGLSRVSVVSNLIKLYDECFGNILVACIPPKRHALYVNRLFGMTCKLNHWNILRPLIENDWIPAEIMPQIEEAVELGHQRVLHILLESLIAPDHRIITTAGVVPKIFRKSKVLAYLPLIAKRFPTEVAWFLEELSWIPIPLCVSRTRDEEPVVRSQLLGGLKLGQTTLAQVVKSTDPSMPAQHAWGQLKYEGQLKSVNKQASENELEIECVICMAPESLVSEAAKYDKTTSRSLRGTNSLIRLLATGEQSIILKPVTKALMEFHWMYGNFWFRFAAQFTMALLSISSSAILFWLIVENSKKSQVSYSSLLAASISTIFLSIFFLIQELRKLLHDRHSYTNINILDAVLHSCILYCAIAGGILRTEVPVIIMALIHIAQGTRILLHLRITPSVGPLVRITIVAFSNVLPILFPMTIVLIAFAGGFYILQHPRTVTKNWNSFGMSFQYVTTMITLDYTMIENPTDVENFLYRIMYHGYLLIFFVNIIIALMTVNLADITANQNSTWIIEVSELMVELEMYWPYPIVYAPFVQNLFANMENVMLSRLGSLDKIAEYNSNNATDELNQLTSITEPLGSLDDFPVILYSAPKASVSKKVWWSSYPKAEYTVPGISATKTSFMHKMIDTSNFKGANRTHSNSLGSSQSFIKVSATSTASRRVTAVQPELNVPVTVRRKESALLALPKRKTTNRSSIRKRLGSIAPEPKLQPSQTILDMKAHQAERLQALRANTANSDGSSKKDDVILTPGSSKLELQSDQESIQQPLTQIYKNLKQEFKKQRDYAEKLEDRLLKMWDDLQQDSGSQQIEHLRNEVKELSTLVASMTNSQ